MPITHRPYAGEDDYQQMRALLVETTRLGGARVYYWTVGDLDWARWGPGAHPNPIGLAQVWWDESGALVGIALPDDAWGHDMVIDLLTHPRQPALIEQMLDWAEAQQRAAPSAAGAARSITTWAAARDHAHTTLLERRGYARTGTAYTNLRQRLDAVYPAPPLPPGYAIRHVQGEADFPARAEVHRDAFAPSRMTPTIYRRLAAEAPGYRADLDLVVVAPDGSFASYCLIWFDDANRIGLFEPVGCHSAYRQRGLTKAVLYEGLRRLQALGATHAYVNTLRGAVAANALYASVGFEEMDNSEGWKKML